MDSDLEKIVILGAGPVGLECALYARYLGYPTKVFEKHSSIAGNVMDWGHVQLFTPFEMNTSPLGLAALEAQEPDRNMPTGDQFHTGLEWTQWYLEPLSKSDLLADNIQFDSKICAVGRPTLGKTDAIGSPSRADDGFRVTVESGNLCRYESADIVIDATGNYGHPNSIGAGPVIGEPSLLNSISGLSTSQQTIEHGFTTGIVDISQCADALRGKKILVVGSGYSAATNILALEQLRHTHNIHLSWLTKHDGAPVNSIENDQLKNRRDLTQRANKIAEQIDLKNNQIINSIGAGESRRFLIEWTSTEDISTTSSEEFDCVIANVGFQGDYAILEPLQLHRCYATGGPMKLAASLLSQNSADCMNVTSDSSTMVTTEPNFYVIGSKSYGRNSQFLFRNGLHQIRDVFQKIVGRDNLDLYKNYEANVVR